MLTNLEQWKKIILSLDDNDFFDIMRNYLGELQTPFNKHTLIEKLLVFLSRETTVERIISLISNADAYLLTLIYSLGEPDAKTLYKFISGSKSFLEFQNHILNLEERLLIFEEPDTGKIRLSPIFRETLVNQVLNTQLIFPSKKITNNKIPPPWFSEALFVALISFLKNFTDLFKLDGSLKKRSKDEINSVFPILNTETESGTRFNLAITSLLKLSLIYLTDGKVSINYDAFSNFSKLPLIARYSLLLAGLIRETKTEKELFNFSYIISSFITALPPDRSFNNETLLSFLKFYTINTTYEERDLRRILYILKVTEILYLDEEDFYTVNPYFTEYTQTEKRDEPLLIIQSSFVLTAKPWITLEDGLPLALSSDVIKYDLFTQYEIRKQSCLNVHYIGLSYPDLRIYLETLSGKELPSNMVTSLNQWADDYSTFRLFREITLVVSESRQTFIDHLEPLKPYIQANPAPGVYILNKDEEKDWSKILNDAGLPVFAEISPRDQDRKNLAFEAYTDKRQYSPLIFIEKSSITEDTSPLFLRKLKESIDKRKFTRSEYEDFSARLEKKLILFPEQIEKALRPKDKAEVGGLDYTGKVRLIHRALDSKRNILEIKSSVLPGNSDRILVKPVSVEHEGDNLVLQAKTLPEEEVFTIPIRKISYVKLLRSSLYAPV